MSLQVIVIVNVIVDYETKINTFSQTIDNNRCILHEMGRLVYEMKEKHIKTFHTAKPFGLDCTKWWVCGMK